MKRLWQGAAGRATALARQYAQQAVEHSRAPSRKLTGAKPRLSRFTKKAAGLHIHVPDAAAAHEAAELIARFGDFAADEAAARACRSREVGNVVHYCRWRQIQRLIEFLDAGGPEATVH